jgi:hypothetical protein
MLPGYYTVLGNADQPNRDDETPLAIVRFYWHLVAAVAPPWVGELTRRLNAAGVPFHAKLLSDPSAYLRADAAVLYVARDDVARTLAQLPPIHAAVAAHLRASTPMFTRRLARGLSVADDPGDGRSFGQHRCQLVAEGLVRAFDTGRADSSEIITAVTGRFAQDGLNISRPWLGAGSPDIFSWPARAAA